MQYNFLARYPKQIQVKIKRMPTDPARIKIINTGNPQKCPVWKLHEVYSNKSICDWVVEGCTKAKFGCIECKQPIINAIEEELTPMQERIAKYQSDPELIKQIILKVLRKLEVLLRKL